ncbi:hypothetical protein K432DRAFT_398917 [Lepidopterella palustris CBS 459.81]|uniref:Uncharacterized protein n=1 Tax=Lepidopterella palustris CBS 459.81 TaxID=1314670 RepID=A0A8E2DXD5_9PEZI|nr:hypothetical protein K432DRAFT_398917 [Lepidopterella palustris CBS 459.81]
MDAGFGRLQPWDPEAVTLMRECIPLRKRILGVGHPYFISSSWEAEQAGIGDAAGEAVAERAQGVNEVSSFRRQALSFQYEIVISDWLHIVWMAQYLNACTN